MKGEARRAGSKGRVTRRRKRVKEVHYCRKKSVGRTGEQGSSTGTGSTEHSGAVGHCVGCLYHPMTYLGVPSGWGTVQRAKECRKRKYSPVPSLAQIQSSGPTQGQ